jgi:hypothetical protein
MKHLHRNVILCGIVALTLVAAGYALLGIGLAVIVAVGLFAIGGVVLAGLIVFEEEVHTPSWDDGSDPDHGYHPAR